MYTGHNFPCDQDLFGFDCQAFTDVPGTSLSMCVGIVLCGHSTNGSPVPLGYIISSNIRVMYVGGVTARIVINCET